MKILMKGQSVPVEMADDAAQTLITSGQASAVTAEPDSKAANSLLAKAKASGRKGIAVSDDENEMLQVAHFSKFQSGFVANGVLEEDEECSGTIKGDAGKRIFVGTSSRAQSGFSRFFKVELARTDAKGKPVIAHVAILSGTNVDDYQEGNPVTVKAISLGEGSPLVYNFA